MQAILNVVLPVFAIILLGFVASRRGLLGAESSEALNRYVYWIAMPPLLFVGMARVPVAQIVNLPFIAAYMAGTFAAALGVVALTRRPMAQRILAALSASFANTGYLGIPLFLAAFGPDAARLAVIATVANAVILMGGSVVAIEASRGAGLIDACRRVARGYLSNPLIMAPILGLGWSLTGLGLPEPVAALFDLLGASAGPSALFAIGLFLGVQDSRALYGDPRSGEVAASIAFKLLLHPALVYGAAWVAGLDPFERFAAVLLAAMPTATLAFIMAQQYRYYVARSAAIILGSTVLSLLTMAAVMVFLRP